jgi:uncharacterized protein (DUF1499 family)
LDYGSANAAAFLPKPMCISLKKQQPLTIPQREQLERLLSVHPSASIAASDINYLTRSEASRLIEALLHQDKP